jgi:heme-degrading monooxygenase HmoA
MMTITVLVTLKQGTEPEWDTAMRQRFEAARSQEGWHGGQLCMPADRLDQRLIIGTWETRAHWEAWHNDPTFAQTRERLDGLQTKPAETRWHEVFVSVEPV